MKKIKLTRGKFALVDDEDYEELSQYKWAANKSYIQLKDGSFANYFYAFRSDNKNRQQIRMHRLIMGVEKFTWVDHADGNALNNQKKNLRVCNRVENARNRKVSTKTKTGYKGVFSVGNKYVAKIGLDNRLIHLGTYPTKKEAARVYDKAAKELFGEFAKPNFN